MNYLPFVKRQIVDIPAAPRKGHLHLSAMAMGPGRTILQDLSVGQLTMYNEYPPNQSGQTADDTGRNTFMMRYGWDKRGYLLEDLHPYGSFVNAGKSMVPVWKFIRPYRMDPGEQLTATIICGGRFSLSKIPTDSYPALVFNGVRVKDNQPIQLYDVARDVTAAGTEVALADSTLKCPADSSVLLYSVAMQNTWDLSVNTIGATQDHPNRVQIFGPGGREWFHWEQPVTPVIPITAGQIVAAQAGWLHLQYNRIKLGEETGWIQERDETFIMEFERAIGYANRSELPFRMAVTLRGSVEVENG